MYYEIIEKIKNHYENNQENFAETNNHYYLIQYSKLKTNVYEISQYYYQDNYENDIEIKTIKNKILSIDCNIEDYLKFVIRFYKNKLEYVQYNFPEEHYFMTQTIIDWYNGF